SLRNLHNIKSSSKVGSNPGVTRHISAFRICSIPLIHVLDSPGIFVPALKKDNKKDIEIGIKLALCGCIRDSIVGTLSIAEYCLHICNIFGDEKRYMELCGVDKPYYDIEKLMAQYAKKLNLYLHTG